MKFRFTKMHGVDSDFVIVDTITQAIFFSKENIKKLADRRTGIGFEYLILVEPPYDPDIDFHYRIFNEKGEEVHFGLGCAGCVAQFVRAKGLSGKNNIPVSLANGNVNLSVEKDSTVVVDIGQPVFEPNLIPFKAKQAEKTYIVRADDYNVLCGVVAVCEPFCIIEENDLSLGRIDLIGKSLSHHERFSSQTKFEFFKINSKNDIDLVTYNEDLDLHAINIFGVCAACAVGINQEKLNSNVTVHIGQKSLNISWEGIGSSIIMKSYANHVYDGEMEIL